MESPRVSIVTPSYNQGQFLERTILSVLTQDYPNIEYIVMDGGSKDNSADIIKKYADKLSYWASEKDKGQSDAINKGWKRATGEIWAYLNSDDVLNPGAVSKIVETFKKHPEAGIVYGDYTFIDANDNVMEECKGKQADLKKLLVDGQIAYIAQPSAFFRADLVKKAGYIDVSFHLAMDYDLLVKLASMAPMVYIPGSLSGFRLHSATKTNSFAKRHWHETIRVLKRYNKSYMVKPMMRYLRFRLFHLLPESVKLKLRAKRNSVHDRMILDSKPDQ